MSDTSLETRFARNFRSLLPIAGTESPRLLVALSGGLDSVVLLHLLRFQTLHGAVSLAAAHLDHRMRPESPADAKWVRGLCRAWEIPLETGAAEHSLRNEADAREARYAFLWKSVGHLEADYLLTAHHADDQAETVLFRIVRGTGLAGLRGIPARSSEGVLRPLLPFWKEEIEAYAREHHLSWRSDSTNEGQTPARNRLRHSVLPEIERRVAAGARRNLVALADLARESESGWRAVVAAAEKSHVRYEDGAVLVARDVFRGYHPALGARILRKVLHRFGTVPGRIGTRSAVQFITDASSGREMRLAGGVRLRTEFDIVRIDRTADKAEEQFAALQIQRPDEGEARSETLRLGGRSYSVEIQTLSSTSRAGSMGAGWSVRFPLDSLRFPLRLRGRRSGDRIRTPGGSRSLKKLMIDRRVPRSRREAVPILEDSEGRILWVAGLATFPLPEAGQDEWTFHLAVQND